MLVNCEGERLKFVQGLVCPICLCAFEDAPKILPECGHSFCAACLEQWMLASGCVETGVLHCPVCKCHTSLNLSHDLRKYFEKNDYCEFDDRQYEAECIVNYLVDKFLPDNPILASLSKSCKKKSIFSKKAQRKTVAATLKKLLTCPVCQEDFQEQPRLLPSCLHSVCLTCLKRSYKRSDEEFGYISCPACWTVHKFRNDKKDSCQYADETGKYKEIPRGPTCGPPKEKLGNSLPFDYVLHWMLDNAPVIRKELGA